MDFCKLLTVAQQNENCLSKQPVACYQTKFKPPKKETKQTKALSNNIKKFLARKEEEERKKQLEEQRKKQNLLALRDQKAQSRINKHLKVCKAANKSVIADAVDTENTAVTMAGPSQPDEDDYGYVSQEASAFYDRLMNKYSNMPPEKPLFSENGKKTVKDIASTKDRVKQALKQQEIEEMQGHRKKRKLSSKDVDCDSKSDRDGEVEKDKSKEKDKESEKESKPKIKKKPPPPTMDFAELLKLAEKKQHEPIVIETKPKPKPETERLMTKKQLQEYQKEKEWRERKERQKLGESSKPQSSASKASKPNVEKAKAEPSSNGISSKLSATSSKTNGVASKSTASTNKRPAEKVPEKNNSSHKAAGPRVSAKDELLEERKKLEAEKKALEEMRRSIEEEKRKLALSKSKKPEEAKPNSSHKPIAKSKDSDKSVSSKNPNSKLSVNNVKPKQFPPPDVRPVKSKPVHMKNDRRPVINKRRIESDEEYDSEMDDFIDDGPEEETEDYSKYISEIFGYDKNKYKNFDDDDVAMESNFAQQLKEEYVSTKIGIMEDLEDIRQEAMEKKRKAMMKKAMMRKKLKK